MFSNPPAITGGGPEGQPDPYVTLEEGTYYLYATNPGGVVCYRSKTLTDWVYLGYALAVPNQCEFWAPSVLRWKGTYYMYYSSLPAGYRDVHEQRIKVAVSDRAEGPFRYVRDLLPAFSIDPHVVENGYGELYMFYSVNDEAASRPGTYIVADRMTDPLHMEGAPSDIVRPTLDEEIFMRDRFHIGQHWHTLEGAFYLKRGEWHYLMYSGNAYTAETYFVGYAVARGEERDLRRLNFRKYPDDRTWHPVLKRSEEAEGTGHNSVTLAPDGETLLIVYHARQRGASPDTDGRTLRLDVLHAEEGKLWVDGPTVGPIPAPWLDQR